MTDILTDIVNENVDNGTKLTEERQQELDEMMSSIYKLSEKQRSQLQEENLYKPFQIKRKTTHDLKKSQENLKIVRDSYKNYLKSLNILNRDFGSQTKI